jgi:SsrA-binding protein
MSTRPRAARGAPPRAREAPLFVDEGRSNFRFAMATAESSNDIESVARNKRARHDYHIMETWEAGLVLTGTEVKSLRNGKANLTDAYGVVNGGEVYLINLHISPYDQGNYFNLLLHRKEIRKLIGSVEREGLTLVPLELYFKRGRAKVAIALGKGKKLHDKRADLRKKDDERDMARAVRHR